MPKVRNAQENHNWFLLEAARYDREAEKHTKPESILYWQNRAVTARLKAEDYLTPK